MSDQTPESSDTREGPDRGASTTPGSPDADGAAYRPETCLPRWGVAWLPEPEPIGHRRWVSFIGPGIVMMGIQIAGGEWLFGPEMTARYGGSMMWIATVAIVVQVFYNMECARYALYCGEPIFTGFLRTRPGPVFWTVFFLCLSLGAIIPGMAYHAASVLTAIFIGRAPGEEDRTMVMCLGYVCLVLVVVPVFFGGKVYNVLQAIMTTKVLVVLSFTFLVGVLFVSAESWLNVFGGFLKFGCVPVADGDGGEKIVNAFGHYASQGSWPVVSLANIAVLGAFAGYAGGGGLGNSMYSNYVRDKGWGMGSQVGAIPSAVGGREIKLSHLGKVFPITPDNERRWRRWWKYIVTDQVIIWAPGCFVGMALPALLSLEFAPHSELYGQQERFDWAQAVITADGMRHTSGLSPIVASGLWFAMLFVGLMVLLPSQMSVVDDVSRRWTDVIWSANRRVRDRMRPDQVKWIYYTILLTYFAWCLFSLYLFGTYGTPKLMTLIIANLGNLAIGFTAFFLLYVNVRLLPGPIRPRLHHRIGLVLCGVFYLGLAVLVFLNTQVPLLMELLGN